MSEEIRMFLVSRILKRTLSRSRIKPIILRRKLSHCKSSVNPLALRVGTNVRNLIS